MRVPFLAALIVFAVPAIGMCQAPAASHSRFDLDASLGWLHATDDAPSSSESRPYANPYRHWNSGLLRNLGAGFYWTEHLKTDVHVGWSTDRDEFDYGYGYVAAPGTSETWVPTRRLLRTFRVSLGERP